MQKRKSGFTPQEFTLAYFGPIFDIYITFTPRFTARHFTLTFNATMVAGAVHFVGCSGFVCCDAG